MGGGGAAGWGEGCAGVGCLAWRLRACWETSRGVCAQEPHSILLPCLVTAQLWVQAVSACIPSLTVAPAERPLLPALTEVCCRLPLLHVPPCVACPVPSPLQGRQAWQHRKLWILWHLQADRHGQSVLHTLLGGGRERR